VLQVDDSKSVCQFNVKFGAALEHVPSLLATARSLSLNVVGISFHVGSGCRDVGAFQDAVQRARTAFDMGTAAGYTFTLLDCGGGMQHYYCRLRSIESTLPLIRWLHARCARCSVYSGHHACSYFHKRL
jgi:diaminopimelate decarboxylase